jgi:hypothetical protein
MRYKPSELSRIRCKIQSAVMFSNAGIATVPNRDRHAAAVEIQKTFIYALSGTFRNTFYERPLGVDGISIRGRRIHTQN